MHISCIALLFVERVLSSAGVSCACSVVLELGPHARPVCGLNTYTGMCVEYQTKRVGVHVPAFMFMLLHAWHACRRGRVFCCRILVLLCVYYLPSRG
jgi:hypothetical protein